MACRPAALPGPDAYVPASAAETATFVHLANALLRAGRTHDTLAIRQLVVPGPPDAALEVAADLVREAGQTTDSLRLKRPFYLYPGGHQAMVEFRMTYRRCNPGPTIEEDHLDVIYMRVGRGWRIYFAGTLFC